MDWFPRINRWSIAGVHIAGAMLASAQAAAAPRFRPTPEYAPTATVLLSADLFAADYHAKELVEAIVAAGARVAVATNAPQSPTELAMALRAQGISSRSSAMVSSLHVPHGNIWMRDYAPLVAINTKQQLHFFDLIYDDPATKLNDRVPQELGQLLSVPVTALALALDGGNFLTNGDLCFSSSTDAPASKDAALRNSLANMGCRETIVFTAPPHVHLDMWAKIVNDHQVLVNELDERTMAVAGKIYGHIPPELQELRDSLNQKAAEWAHYLEVKRLPMPLPYRGAFRTYSNAVLVNGHAIVPSYQRFGWNYDSYPDAELASYYAEKVRKIYESLGFNVQTVNADGLIYNGGAFHCVTAQLPKRRAAPSIDINQRRKGH